MEDSCFGSQELKEFAKRLHKDGRPAGKLSSSDRFNWWDMVSRLEKSWKIHRKRYSCSKDRHITWCWQIQNSKAVSFQLQKRPDECTWTSSGQTGCPGKEYLSKDHHEAKHCSNYIRKEHHQNITYVNPNEKISIQK